MKLSERMDSIGILQVSAYTGDVRALEAELDAERLRAMELTARADRLRVERDAAQAFNEIALDRATQVRGRAERESAEAVAILHLVYEMREHALRRDRDAECAVLRARIHANNDAERVRYSALHRRAQAAESRATKAEREVATLRVRLQGAIAKIPPGDLWRTPDPVVTATFAPGWKCGDACEANVYAVGWRPGTIVGFQAPNYVMVELPAGDTGTFRVESVRRPIPLAALEARPERHARVVYGPLTEHPRDDAPPSSDVASRCPFCRGARCVPGVLPDQPDRCVACAPDVPPSNAGARGLDAAERFVLEAPTVCPTHETGSGFCSFDCPDRVPNPAYPGARRRVTERVEDERPCETCGTLACETCGSHQCALLHVARLRAAIAERDARIEALEAETALWRKATGHDDAEHLDFVLGRAGIDTHLRVAYELRDEAIARAERAEGDRGAYFAMNATLRADLAAEKVAYKRLRTAIARIREICAGDRDAAYDLRADILAELGGER